MDQNFTIINSADFEKILQRMEGFENALVVSKQTSSQKIFSEEEVTKLLHLSPKTMQNYRRDGKIGYIQPKGGRRILYTAEHIEDFLRDNEIKKIKAKL
jgi:hypothetical protein